MSTRTALITGMTGQDGSYLAEYCCNKATGSAGLCDSRPRRTSGGSEHLLDNIELLQADLLDQTSLDQAISSAQPDEVYNLAAQSFVPVSWEQPLLTGEFTGAGRHPGAGSRSASRTRRSASTRRRPARCSARCARCPRPRRTPFYPRAPTACAKVYGHWITVNYRESTASTPRCGILFNHESPRRGLEFVTRKITHAVARIKLGLERRAASRQPGRQARLGLRGRLRAGHVAHAPAGRAPTTT